MAIKVFLDANIILEAYLDRAHKKDAVAILSLIADHTIEGYTSPSVIQICVYFLEKEMTSTQVSRLFLSLLQYIDLCDTNKETAVAAFTSNAKDFEDAILYFTAVHHGMDYFLTLDNRFSKNKLSVLPVLSPSQLLAKL